MPNFSDIVFPFIFLGVPLLAITGTATKKMQTTIMQQLGMGENTVMLNISPNRENIRFSVIKTTKTDQLGYLRWLIDIIKERNLLSPKTIIYCATMHDVAKVFGFLLAELGDSAYVAEKPSPREQVGGNLPFYDSRLNTNLGVHIHLKITWDKSVLLLQPLPSVWESIFLMLDMSSTLAQQEVLLTTYRKPEELEEMVPVHIMLCYTMVISSPIVKKLSSNLHVQGVVSEKLYLRTLMMSQAIILHMNAAASVTTIVYVLVRSVVKKDFLLMSQKG